MNFIPAVNIIKGVDFRSAGVGSVPDFISETPSTRELIDLMVASKKATGRRLKYTQGLRSYLNLFCDFTGCKSVGEISANDVEIWFANRLEKPSTRNSNLGRLSALFEFARRKKYVRENIVRDVEKAYVEKTNPKILTVAQCRTLMDRAVRLEPSLIPYLALALFMGIRPEEIKRLRPEDVKLNLGVVEISGAVAKTRQRRLVTINATARAWLDVNATLPVLNLRRKLRRVRSEWSHRKWVELVTWTPDVLRHTAASMLYQTHGAAHTSRELGHSESVLFSNYRSVVTPEDAAEFWRVMPTGQRELF